MVIPLRYVVDPGLFQLVRMPMTDNPEEFVRLLTRNQRQIWWFINTMLPGANDADDVLQETSMVLLEKWKQFDREREFLPWACGVARLQVFRFVRQHRTSRLYLDESILSHIADVAEKSLQDSDNVETRLDALRQCIERLDEDSKKLVESRYWTSQSTKQISKTSGKPLVTVYKHLAKARTQLMNCVVQRISSHEGAS